MKAEHDGSRRELLERFRRWLRDRHLPVTRQRDLVARTVFDSTAHLSVDEIQRLLRDQQLRVGTATIYRSLEVLLQSGLVRSHDFGEGFKRYEATAGEGQHGHLICGRCGGVTEFSTERFERILPIVADEHGFQYQRHRVEVHGLCRACREADYGALTRAGRSR
ncbi:MAG: Fur family transcriptional regulator [Gemmatimonadales bacterium]